MNSYLNKKKEQGIDNNIACRLLVLMKFYDMKLSDIYSKMNIGDIDCEKQNWRQYLSRGCNEDTIINYIHAFICACKIRNDTIAKNVDLHKHILNKSYYSLNTNVILRFDDFKDFIKLILYSVAEFVDGEVKFDKEYKELIFAWHVLPSYGIKFADNKVIESVILIEIPKLEFPDLFNIGSSMDLLIKFKSCKFNEIYFIANNWKLMDQLFNCDYNIKLVHSVTNLSSIEHDKLRDIVLNNLSITSKEVMKNSIAYSYLLNLDSSATKKKRIMNEVFKRFDLLLHESNSKTIDNICENLHLAIKLTPEILLTVYFCLCSELNLFD